MAGIGKLLALKSRRGRVRSIISARPAGTVFEEGDFALPRAVRGALGTSPFRRAPPPPVPSPPPVWRERAAHSNVLGAFVHVRGGWARSHLPMRVHAAPSLFAIAGAGGGVLLSANTSL
jgi:hypothetical protein